MDNQELLAWLDRQRIVGIADLKRSELLKLNSALEKADDQDLGLKPLHLHVLRSATLEPMKEALCVEAALTGIKLKVSFGSYAPPEVQVHDQDLTQSLEQADVLLISLELADLCPAAINDPLGSKNWIEEACSRLLEITHSLRAQTSALFIIQLPVLQRFGLDGFADLLQPDRTGERFEAFRKRCWQRFEEQLSHYVFFDTELLVREVGAQACFDQRLWQLYRTPWSTQGMRAFASMLSRMLGACFLPRAKCLVLDCDNTLWGGVLGEKGIEGIGLGTEGEGAAYLGVQREALSLARRGILLALLSKNDRGLVYEALEKHPHMLLRPSLIAADAISWEDKASGIRQIAQNLNIGLDALVFVDDRGEECEIVRQLVPEVQVYQLPGKPQDFPGFLLGIREFDLARTLAADHARSEEYQSRKQRAEHRALVTKETQEHLQAGDVLATQADAKERYLQSLELRVRTLPARGEVLMRVVQMEAKTNQFNLRTARLSQPELEALLAEGGEVFAMSLADKFGDYGITLAASLKPCPGEPAKCFLSNLLLSCRVIGLGAEKALFAELAAWAQARGFKCLRGEFVFTERNTPASGFFEEQGFRKVEEQAKKQVWEYDLTKPVVWPEWIYHESE